MKVVIEGLAGMRPRKDPKLLDAHQAQEATNCKLWRGTLAPWSKPANQSYDPAGGNATTIYYYQGLHWFEWDKDVDVIRSPIANDAYRRVYWTGDGPPKKTDQAVATTAHPYPSTEYLLEVPKPASAPGASVQCSADQSNLESVAYVTTYVSDYGEEGQPSDASALASIYWRNLDITGVDTGIDTITVDGDESASFGSGDTVAIVGSTSNDGAYTVASASYDGSNDETNIQLNEAIYDATVDGKFRTRVHLTGLPTAPNGAYNMNKVRIYRYMAGTTNGEYVYVDEVAIGTTSYQDSVAPEELGEVIPTSGYNTPPDDMAGLVIMANGVAAGFSGNEVCLSEPYLPHTYPSGYRQSTDYPIVGLGTFATNLAVLTEGHPYMITDVDPASMTMEEVELPQACVSKRGIVSTQSGVIYPSPDGLVWLGSGPPEIITRDILTKDQWQAYGPSSVHAYYYDNRYFGFYDNGTTRGGFIFDPQDPANSWTEVDYYASAGYSHLQSDSLFLVIAGSIDEWDAGTDKMQYKWRSKVFQSEASVNFTSARVIARDYSHLMFRLYADGTQVMEQHVESEEIFRLPSGFRAREWEIELVGTAEVQRVAIASRPQEIG